MCHLDGNYKTCSKCQAHLDPLEACSCGDTPTTAHKGSEAPGRTPADNSAGATRLLGRIDSYLGNGGFFNPEMMDHNNVRGMIIDCYETINRQQNEAHEARVLEVLYKRKLNEVQEELLATIGELARVRAELIAIQGETSRDTR